MPFLRFHPQNGTFLELSPSDFQTAIQKPKRRPRHRPMYRDPATHALASPPVPSSRLHRLARPCRHAATLSGPLLPPSFQWSKCRQKGYRKVVEKLYFIAMRPVRPNTSPPAMCRHSQNAAAWRQAAPPVTVSQERLTTEGDALQNLDVLTKGILQKLP